MIPPMIPLPLHPADVLDALAELVAQRLAERGPANPSDLLDAAEVGRRLGRHPDTVRDDLRAGRLPGVKVGRSWRVSAGDLDAVLRGQDRARREDQARDARVAEARAKLKVRQAQWRAGA